MDLSQTAIATKATSKHGSYDVFPALIASGASVDDVPSISDAARALTVMKAFAEKWGPMKKLAHGVT